MPVGVMGFISILDNGAIPQFDKGRPTFFIDFNLDQVINHIQGMSLVPVEKYYYCMPENKACEDYRRAIYQDVKKPEINRFLNVFTERVAERKQAISKKKDADHTMQKSVWHILEVACYCEAYSDLYEGLTKAEITSEGFQALRDFLHDYVTDAAFAEMKKKAFELRDKLEHFRIKLVYENEQLVVSEDTVEGTYEKFLRDNIGESEVRMKSPFSESVLLNHLELEIIRKFTKRQPGFFKDAKEFFQEYGEYESEVLIRFGDDIAYYLSYYNFQRKMEQAGYHFVAPTAEQEKDMSACGLYDLALACANINTGKPVVSNDMVYCPGERFFVVTGPNQGGKTTFARSLGQLVYLGKMGFDVPATAANVHSFSGILSHFSVEESVETGRGKLMEELTRLKPMLQVNCKNAFVVINELFTTAANYDACIMGKKVLEHFIEQDCMGIYVTHLKELSAAHESVVSMRAMLDEQKVQNFKIQRREADDTMCALNQVNKYRLTYEQLKERLG